MGDNPVPGWPPISIQSCRRRVPGGDKGLLVLASVLACFLVVADADLLPFSWVKILNLDGPVARSPIMWPAVRDLTQVFPGSNGPDVLRMTWAYGATTAVWAAFTLLLASIASPEAPRTPVGTNPDHHFSRFRMMVDRWEYPSARNDPL